MNWRDLVFWRNHPTEHAQKGAELIELRAESNEVLRHAQEAERKARNRLGSYSRSRLPR